MKNPMKLVVMLALTCGGATRCSKLGSGSVTSLGASQVKPQERKCETAAAMLRTSDLPLGTQGAATFLCSLKAGEWVDYTVNVATAGNYDLEAIVATPYEGNKIRIEFRGVPQMPDTPVPVSTSWDDWQKVRRNKVHLEAGTQIMRVFSVSDDTENSFAFDKVNVTASP